jgi:hypothetical protein
VDSEQLNREIRRLKRLKDTEALRHLGQALKNLGPPGINGIITRRGSQQAIVAMHANIEGRIK